MNSIRGITINTDASFCHETNAAGWAFHIISDNFKYKLFGEMKSPALSASHAEIMAIGNAIAYLLKQPNLPTANFIVINTDSKEAIIKIENQITDAGKFVIKQIDKLITRTQCKKIEFRHVKAHSKVADSRSLVNEWCDRYARASMRNMRKKLKEAK